MPYLPVCARPAGCARCYGPGGGAGGVIGIGTVTNGKCRYIVTGGWWGTGGAALASANAPLFASSTAALAYALDPGTGEMDPPAFNPTYLDVWGDTGAGTGVRAYSAVPDEEEPAPRRPWSMLLAGGALAGIAAVIGGVVLATLTPWLCRVFVL